VFVQLTASVVFESVADHPWDGFTIKKVVDLPIEPAQGLEWFDAVWPHDALTITTISIWQGQNPCIECECTNSASPNWIDDCEYGTYDDARESYREAGWAIEWEASEKEGQTKP